MAGVGHHKEGDQRMMAKLVLVGSCTGHWQGGIRTHRGRWGQDIILYTEGPSNG